MKNKVIYNYNDKVMFMFGSMVKIGVIDIIDPHGTFGQHEEPSYDIYIKEENCLYKHIRQSKVLKKLKKKRYYILFFIFN